RIKKHAPLPPNTPRQILRIRLGALIGQVRGGIRQIAGGVGCLLAPGTPVAALVRSPTHGFRPPSPWREKPRRSRFVRKWANGLRAPRAAHLEHGAPGVTPGALSTPQPLEAAPAPGVLDCGLANPLPHSYEHRRRGRWELPPIGTL